MTKDEAVVVLKDLARWLVKTDRKSQANAVECLLAWPFEDAKVPPDWTNGVEMTVEEWGQKEYDFGRRTGIEAGVKKAAEWLLAKASQAFADGNDGKADLLRKLSREVKAIKAE